MTTRREWLKGAVSAGIAAGLLRPTTSFSEAGGVGRPASSTGFAQTALGPLDPSNLGFTLTHAVSFLASSVLLHHTVLIDEACIL